MKRLLYFLSLAATLGLSGCEDVVDLTVPRTAPLLVVDGAVTDQPGPSGTLGLVEVEVYEMPKGTLAP